MIFQTIHNCKYFVFTTENGVASIVLREIPYKGIAYITLQDTLQPEKLLRECVEFCKAAGADRIYGKGVCFRGGRWSDLRLVLQERRLCLIL